VTELTLSPAEARVLACLVEKSILTPQYYPMTVNAVMLAANQKTVRSPLMSLSEGDAGAALNALERERLASRDESGSRAVKWRHQMQHQLLLKPGEMALLVSLMLRGPQTVSELRANAQPLGGPADAEGVQAALASLADRAQPLVLELPRGAGQKEARQAHLLCGQPAPSVLAAAAAAPVPRTAAELSALTILQERVQALEQRVAELERRLGTGG
jgi:uncharacterized protein YceH (UPF0502 family)